MYVGFTTLRISVSSMLVMRLESRYGRRLLVIRSLFLIRRLYGHIHKKEKKSVRRRWKEMQEREKMRRGETRDESRNMKTY